MTYSTPRTFGYRPPSIVGKPRPVEDMWAAYVGAAGAGGRWRTKIAAERVVAEMTAGQLRLPEGDE